MEADLRSADKKLAENLKTIQKLNRDVERRDKEIEDLESADRQVVDTVQPPLPGVADCRSILERLRQVLDLLRNSSQRQSSQK